MEQENEWKNLILTILTITNLDIKVQCKKTRFRFNYVWEKAVCYRTTDLISSSSTYFKHGQASDFEI